MGDEFYTATAKACPGLHSIVGTAVVNPPNSVPFELAPLVNCTARWNSERTNGQSFGSPGNFERMVFPKRNHAMCET